MKLRLVLYPLAIVMTGCLATAIVHQDGPREAGETALKDRDWAKAERLLSDALGSAKEKQDEILYLLATAQQRAGKHDAAIATLDRLVKDHAASPLRMKALFKKGDVLAAKKEFAIAAGLYDQQVTSLTAPERRKRLAMVYVEAGREFLTPKDAKDPTFVANYVAAQKLLAKSLELESLGADEEGVRADIVACELKGNFDRNLLHLSCKSLLEKFPKAARLDEVLFAQGSAHRDLKRPWEAKKSWARLAAEAPASKLAPEGLYLAALIHVNEAGQTADLEELRLARPILARLAKDFGATEWGIKAAYLSAAALAQYDDLRDDARRELTAFVDAHVKDERAPEALLRIAQLWRADQDDAKAIATFEDFLKRFPDSPRWPEVRGYIADVRFGRVERAFVRKDWPAGRTAAQEFVDLHPTDGRAPGAAFRVGESLKQEKKFKEAVEAWLKVAGRFAGHDEGSRARYAAAEVLATELDDVETALKELQKPCGCMTGPAQHLTAKLQAKSVALESERVFRTDETPKVKMTVRNNETVKFRLWTLDLKDYFEKKASTGGLQNLEVSVIAPDKEWEHSVKDFRRFKEMKIDVELPKKEPGAYVVTASAGAQEATSIVLVSDLAMIARAGRKGATVLAQNTRTGAAVADAVIHTAADGRHLKAWTKDTIASRLSFLVESGGQLAFRDVDVTNMAIAAERNARAIIVTDRTRYAAEDEVHVRMTLRDVVDGAYVVPKDKKYVLAAVSPGGVTFFETQLAVSKVGTSTTSFRLLRGMTGDVRIDVLDATKPLHALVGRTAVKIAPAEPRAANFDFLYDDRTYFIGEDVDVTVVLRDAWNCPMPNRRMHVWTITDAEWREVTTDAAGSVAVPIRETAQQYRGWRVHVQAKFENVQDVVSIPMHRRGVQLSFDEASRVTEPVLKGDSKTIVVKAARADDSPVVGTYSYKVVRTNEAGEMLPVATGQVTTDAAGKGSFAFAAADAGIHTVTVFMKDEDGLPVRTQTAVQVFDDADERKLRLRAPVDEFEPGKPMEFTIVSRLAKGLAFVTVEGEKVEQVVQVTLDKGANTVKLAPPPTANRDFSVAVLMMQDNKFHTDAREFRLKQPEVKIEPEKKEYRPGEEAVVRVKAPAGSEVILTVGERVTGEIDVHAYGPLLQGAHFIGDSSAATAFAFATQQLDPRLIDALARLENLAGNPTVRVMLEKDLEQLDKRGLHDSMGVGGGGGSGGRYGGRFGGRQTAVARGGGGRATERNHPDPAPLTFASATADATGMATFRFRLPQGWADYVMRAWSIDGSNVMGHAFEELKARAAVTAEYRLPESAVEGEATSAVVVLANHSSKEQDVTMGVDGSEVKVKLAARSTRVDTFAWKGATRAEFALDGVKHEERCALRPRGGLAEKGGAFNGKSEITVEGDGKLHVRVATGPIALLESLTEGRDALSPASDAAAALIARVARHRYAKTDATKRAVMEFVALRQQGLIDAASDDAAWPVLVYLAAAEAKAAELEITLDASHLKARFAQATHDDVKALILFALARGGEAQYGYIHRLWRNPDSLSPRALACVALALKGAGKAEEAKQAIDRLAKLVKEDHWEAAALSVPDVSNTDFGATALAVFAMAEIDPANALSAKARAWLLGRSPATASERAFLALAMQSTTDKSDVTDVKVEVAAGTATLTPTGAGVYYALARREVAKRPEPAVKVAVKRTVEWPVLVVEGLAVARPQAAVKEPVENASMAKVASGEAFPVTYELTVAGPTTRYYIVELPAITGLRTEASQRRILLTPQTESERKLNVTVWAYADAPGSYDELDVLAAGAPYRQGWQLTHAERLGVGRVHFEKKQWKQGKDVLAPLFEKGTLHDAAMIEAARMLAYAGVELQDHATVVKYFEILKEKSPAEVVPFDKIRGVGRAYAAVGEHERAMQVHQGTCDAYFLQEANVSGALEELGRTRQSTDEMKRLILDHPDSQLNREMVFGLGQALYTAAKTHRDPAEKDARRLTRAELLGESSAALERYLAWFPDDKDGERVVLTLGSAYLEAGKHDTAERTGRASASRFGKSRFLDSYDYLLALSLFAQRKFSDSLVMCDRLETFDYGRHSNPGPALMRERAVLIKAQIFHAKGELDKALENYKKVRGTSADAARSIAFLEREAIAMPDVTVAPLGKGAEIEFEYAGVAEAHVRAYKVDLTMLALRRHGLADAASVEVAGFRPVFEKSIKLDHPNAKRREKQKLAIDLKDPGAYLVGVKAGDFFASGIVLRSNLTMLVQEERAGHVRVNVADGSTGSFAEGVKVTIFGTEDQKIASDKTDLRGIWETAGVVGLAVVVAEKDGHVAMFRGQAAIGIIEQQKRKEAGQQALPQQDALDEQIQGANEYYERNWRDNMNKQQQGVEVERTKK